MDPGLDGFTSSTSTSDWIAVKFKRSDLIILRTYVPININQIYDTYLVEKGKCACQTLWSLLSQVFLVRPEKKLKGNQNSRNRKLKKKTQTQAKKLVFRHF